MLNSDAPIFDLPEELQMEVFSIYIEDSSKDLALINESIESKNWEEIRRVAHKLKGACAMIGATELQKKSKLIEDLLDEGSFPGEKDIIQLSDLHNSVLLYLKKIIIS